MKISLSHYSGLELGKAVLRWKLLSDGRVVDQGQFPVPECERFAVTDLGCVHFTAPQVTAPSRARLEISLLRGDPSLLSTDQEIYIFPVLSPSGRNLPIYSPAFRGPLQKLGYQVTEELSEAKVAVVSVLDDSYREFILRGGRALLLAEDEEALQMYVPRLKIKEREETAWQGDWASSFGWHRFDKLPTGGVVDFSFTGLTPEHILAGFAPRDFALNVYAGLFVGWLHKPVPTIAKRRLGEGEVFVSTFRLSKNLESNPLAMLLFAELLALTGGA
jgi:hypothetical protein